MKKKLFSILLCSALVFAMAVPAFADGNSFDGDTPVGPNNTDPTEYVPLEEQFEEYCRMPGATDEQIAAYAEIIAINQAIERREDISMPYAEGDKVLPVPFYEQQEDYYCGPASVLQVFAYLNTTQNKHYTLPTQVELADALDTTRKGTDTGNMRSYLNQKFNAYYSVLWS